MRQRPFAPYAIVTKDGQRIRVIRPNQAATNERVVLVAEPTGDKSKRLLLSDVADIIDIG
jgi:hypothetical protein